MSRAVLAGVSPARWLGLGLVAAAGSLPLLPLLSAVWPAMSAVERAFEPWFALHCHREPARTLSVAAVPLAVCARCTGLYVGFGLGVLVRRPRLPARALRGCVLLAALLMLADVWLETRCLHRAHAELRVLTGFLLGYPVGLGLGAAIVRAPARAHSP